MRTRSAQVAHQQTAQHPFLIHGPQLCFACRVPWFCSHRLLLGLRRAWRGQNRCRAWVGQKRLVPCANVRTSTLGEACDVRHRLGHSREEGYHGIQEAASQTQAPSVSHSDDAEPGWETRRDSEEPCAKSCRSPGWPRPLPQVRLYERCSIRTALRFQFGRIPDVVGVWQDNHVHPRRN